MRTTEKTKTTSALPENCVAVLAAKLNHHELAELFDKFDKETILNFFEHMMCSSVQNKVFRTFSANERSDFMSFSIQLQKLITQKEVANGN